MVDEAVYLQYLSGLLAGDRTRCMETVSLLLEKGTKPEHLYTVFQRALYSIGELWEQNRISVAVEHLATAITETLLAAVYPIILSGRSKIDKKVIVSCSVNEYHQVGARMVADIMESHGWDAWFLGANTPAEDLLLLIQEKKPDMLALSISIYFNMASLGKLIQIVRSNYPGLSIIVGGQAFRWGEADVIKPFGNVTYFPSLEKLIQEIRLKG
jgi:methanogenic corrinoid protein MtbC1